MKKNILLSFAALFCWAGVAAAQQPMPQNSGPLVLEPISSHGVFAPEVKFTQFAGTTGTLVGAYGGVLKDDQFFIGGGGYGLVDSGYQHSHTSLGYGGVIIGWVLNPRQPVSASVKTLLGFGSSSEPYTATYTVPVYDPHPPKPPQVQPVTPPTLTTVTETIQAHSDFFVAEPEVNLIARINHTARLSAGIGYRLVANNYYIPHPHGLTGSFSVQFGF